VLTVAGLFWLKEGENRAGASAANQIVLPPRSAPERVGTFVLRGGKTTFTAERGSNVTSGGRALKFYATVRADIRRIAAIKEGDTVIGSRTKVKIVKNKLAAPFREAEFDIIYGEGISREGDLLDLGVAHNVLEKSGSWFSYKGERIGQGRESARQFLKDNADVRQKLDTELRKLLGLIRESPAAAAKSR
jgi:hypothetical protein